MKPVIYQLLVRLAGNRNISKKPFGSIDENGCGKFNDLDAHFLGEIKNLGVTHLWLTGVLEHASCTDYSAFGIVADNPLIVKGLAGSPYAIKDYYDVCPDLAINVNERMQEFEDLLKRCNGAGLIPIIDFVPNHVARQYRPDNNPPGIKSLGENDKSTLGFHPNNNFYYLPGQALRMPREVYELPYVKDNPLEKFVEEPAKATGNDQFTAAPSINDWYETIKLNYGVDYQGGGGKHFDPIPDTWQKMGEILLFWAQKGVKGFRCDMAEMVPVEFWQWAIGEVKNKLPEVIFIAEIYNPGGYKDYVETGGFDFLYDKVGLYDTLREVMTGRKPASSITRVWQDLDGLDSRKLRFLENHDEQRIASRQFAGNARAGIPAMAVAATLHQGPLMVYFGQELGEPAEGAAGFSGDDGRTTIFDYFHVPAFQQWFNNGKCIEEKLSTEQKSLRRAYKQLIKLCKDPIIASGNFYDLQWYNQNKPGFKPDSIFCYLRWNKEKIWMIAANFSQVENLNITIRIPKHFFETVELADNQDYVTQMIQPESESPGRLSQEELIENGITINIESNNYLVICLRPSK
ncbi:MAG: alpha-amylase family protein [Bacteroidales bacterium]|nr:alpha-amylase family protein [Bacteroidales bacterium]